jgi:hypothetical protein
LAAGFAAAFVSGFFFAVAMCFSREGGLYSCRILTYPTEKF